jgi:hypothetical protein
MLSNNFDKHTIERLSAFFYTTDVWPMAKENLLVDLIFNFKNTAEKFFS